MSFIKDWLKAKYKIVPVYTTGSKIIGYTVLHKDCLGWLPMKMYEQGESEMLSSVDCMFSSYDDALSFLKHNTTILTNEKISD